MFFRDYYEVGTKSGKYEIEFKVKTFIFRDDDDFGRKIQKKKIDLRWRSFFLENTKFWDSLPRTSNFEYLSLLTTYQYFQAFSQLSFAD